MAKRHRDGFFEDMKKMLKLSEHQHFEVHVDDTPDIANPVVFYIKELLTELAGKYGMTLPKALQTIHDAALGQKNMGFINQAFDDPIALRAQDPAPPSRLSNLLVQLKTVNRQVK